MALVTAIEFTDLECKVMQADRGKGRVAVKSLFTFTLPKNDDQPARVQERARLLREQAKAHKTKIQRAVVIIPKSYVLVRMVTLPSTSEDELAGMVRFEAERHIPFNAERHIVSHHVLSKQGVQGSQVLLAALDQPIAQEYLDICIGAGIEVQFLTVSSLAMFNAFAYAEQNSIGEKVVALVNIGSSATDLAIANSSALSFTRASTLGVAKLAAESGGEIQITAQDLAAIDALETIRSEKSSVAAKAQQSPVNVFSVDDLDMPVFEAVGGGPAGIRNGEPYTLLPADLVTPVPQPNSENIGGANFGNWMLRLLVTNWLVQLLKEVKRTYEFACREFNCPSINNLYVTGEGALIKSLPQFFKANFGMECAVFDPMQAFDIPKRIAAELANSSGLQYCAVAGGVVPSQPHSVSINLLPSQYLAKRQTKRQQQSWIISGALILTAFVLGYLYVSDLFTRQDQLLQEYRKQNVEMKDRVADLEAKKAKLQIIRTYIQDKRGPLDVLNKISEFPFIPEKVTMTRIEYRKFAEGASEDGVKVAGYAMALPDINKMQLALQSMETDDGEKFFESVTQDQGSNQPVRLPNRPQQVLGYSMTCSFPKKALKKTAKKAAAKKESSDGTE